MNNYFDNAQVRWNLWSPQTIYFKSNNMLKKLIPSENLLSYKSKSDRNEQMGKISGGKLMSTNRYGSGNYQYYSQTNHHAVHVWLKDMKSGYPSAHIDFVDMRERKNSVGHNLGRLDVLVYINSYHCAWEWHRDINGNYTKRSKSDIAPLEEGYRICYGGQGDANPLSYTEFNEILDISESVRRFLIDKVVDTQQLKVA